jgi:hypothetical protein
VSLSQELLQVEVEEEEEAAAEELVDVRLA